MSTAICDFCSDPNVEFAYPARDFNRPVAATPQMSVSLSSTGGWAACRPCHDLIEATDREGLYRRSFERFGPSPLPAAIIGQSIRRVQDVFWSQRDGAAVPATPEGGDPTRGASQGPPIP